MKAVEPTSKEITVEMTSNTHIPKDLKATNIKQEYTTNIPVVQVAPLPPPPTPPTFSDHRYIRPQTKLNYPKAYILGSREDYFNICVPLYEASVTGDWKAAKTILDLHPEYVGYAISENYETALHVVASTVETKQTERFVEHLLQLMERKDLEFQNKSGNTAFIIACAAGNTKMTKMMLEKNRQLLHIPNIDKKMSLYISVLYGKYDTTNYLYDNSEKMTGDFWTPQNRGWLLSKCVEYDFFDVALKILEDNSEPTMIESVLGVLARKPDAFNGAEPNSLTTMKKSFLRFIHMKNGPVEEDSAALKLLTVIMRSTIKRMTKVGLDNMLRGPADIDPLTNSIVLNNGKPQYSSRILFLAAEMGNTKFIVKLLRAYPDLICNLNEDGYSIFHVAVKNRRQDVYNLLYEIGPMKDMLTPLEDKNGNNMLHLVANTSSEMRHKASGASLLMQRELLWFKEVEKLVPPSYRHKKNKDGLTPYELFSKVNKDLVTEGLKWMKDCMVVATLIVTVAFAVAFTVPGGYNQEVGIPFFIHGNSFLAFVIADAISLFSSSTSLLVFLSILTSRHGERDFLYSLPSKLMIGLVTLFISVAAMMVTFSASFFVLYHNGLIWVSLLIATFAAMPVIIFALLQFPHLVDMFRSMYDSRYLFKPRRRMLYNTNPRF